MKITFIQTGGTIDKDYPKGEDHHGYEFKIADSAFLPILKKANPSFAFEVISVLKKDSLDITESDREKIYTKIKSIKNDKIIISHGTDTIHLTAEKLSSISDKTIVITGSMLPEKFYDSDAEFNVGMAVGAVQTLVYGCYIALHGRVMLWNEPNK